MQKACGFVGQDKLNNEQLKAAEKPLENAIKSSIKEGYRMFVNNFMYEADLVAANEVIKQKESGSKIYLECVMVKKSEFEKFGDKFEIISKKINGYKFLRDAPFRYKFHYKIESIVSSCDRLIVVWNGRKNGSSFYVSKAIFHAKKLEKDLVIIKV